MEININELNERMANSFVFMICVLEDRQETDWLRSKEIAAKGEEMLAYYWDYHFRLESKYQLGVLARVSMFNELSLSGTIKERWHHMSSKVRKRILGATLRAIDGFHKTCDDVDAAKRMGVLS